MRQVESERDIRMPRYLKKHCWAVGKYRVAQKLPVSQEKLNTKILLVVQNFNIALKKAV